MKIEPDFASFSWDFEKNVAGLSGLSKLLRLVTIYNNAKNAEPLREQAGHVLIEALTKTSCSGLLRRITGDALSMLRSNVVILEWEKATDAHMTEILSVLDAELNQAKSMAVKESIRSGYFNLGLHFWQWGRLEDALKHFYKCRDFCSTSQHYLDVNVYVVSCLLDMNQFLTASGFCNKINESAQDSGTLLRSKALLGLLAIQERNFVTAARYFLDLNGDIGHEWNFLLSSCDIGFYGTLSALLSFSRQQMQSLLQDNKVFVSTFLVLQPELKEFVTNVYEKNEYSNVMTFLRWLYTRLSLELHAQSAAKDIVQAIHDKLFAQYLEPFAAVSLERFANDFQLNVETEVRPILIELVTAKKIQCRIDFRSGRILRGQLATDATSAVSTLKRKQMLEKMMVVQEEHIANLKRALFLLSLRKNKLVVDDHVRSGSAEDMSGKAARILGGTGGKLIGHYHQQKRQPRTSASKSTRMDTEDPEDEGEGDSDSPDEGKRTTGGAFHRMQVDGGSDEETASET